MKHSSIVGAIAILATAFASPWAAAHPGHELASGAIAGLMHPLTGFDHLIALLAAGALLAQEPARARWGGVAALLAALATGAGVGLAGVALPGAEWMIVLSLLAAACLLLGTGTAHPLLLGGGMALFALFHGYAHGVESSGAAAAFVAGFLASSLAIVLSSQFAARLYIERRSARLAAGAGAGAAGVALLLQLAS